MAQRLKRQGKNSPPVPSYYKLQMELLNGIEKGKWAPEEAIPPERKLAESFGVSIGTVNRAIMNLVTQGYLYRIQGKGTFVSGTDIRGASVRYTRLRAEFKNADPVFKINLLGLSVIDGQQQINKYLRIPVNQKVYRLERVFIEKEKPIIYNISYLPEKKFAAFSELPLSYLEKTTLYEAIEKKYGLPTIFNQELFGVATADNAIAETLQIKVGQPVLKIEMLSFTYKDKPYEYRLSYCSGRNRKMYREM